MHSSIHSFIHTFVHPPSHSYTYSSIYLFIHSYIHLFIHLVIYLLLYIYSSIYSSIYHLYFYSSIYHPFIPPFIRVFKSHYPFLIFQGLHTLGAVLVDYRGFRVFSQSIIPGLLQKEHASSIEYGSMDNGKTISMNDKFHELVRLLLLSLKLITSFITL